MAIVTSARRRINSPSSRAFPAMDVKGPRTGIFLTAVCLLAALAHGADAQEDELARILTAISDRYRFATGLRVQFEQRYRHRLHDREVRASGVIRARPPDLVRIDFDDGRVAVADTTMLRVLELSPTPGRLLEQPIGDSPMLPPIALLRGEAHLATDYDARFVETGERELAGRVVEIRPRERQRLWDRAWLYVDDTDADRGRVRRMMIIDEAGNLNRWDFRAESLRVRLRDDVFVLSPPEGALRVEL